MIEEKNPFITMGPELQQKIQENQVLKRLVDRNIDEIVKIYATCTHKYVDGTPAYSMQNRNFCNVCNQPINKPSEDTGSDNEQS